MEYYMVQQPSDFTWQAREVVKELNKRPHLVLSIEIKGTHFPHRDAVPFARIVQAEGRVMNCWFAEIAEDNLSLKAYFTLDVPETGKIEFGYGNVLLGAVRLDFDRNKVSRLDRNRLPKEIVLTTEKNAIERRDVR